MGICTEIKPAGLLLAAFTWLIDISQGDSSHLDAHSLLDPDAFELVLDGFALLFGLGRLFVCLLSFCSPLQLVSFLTCTTTPDV